MLQRLQTRLKEGGLGSTLLRGGLGSSAVQGVHLAARVLTAVVLARVLGAEGFGIYVLVMAIMRVINLPVQAGIAKVGLRFTAAYVAGEYWGELRGLWRRLVQWTLCYGIAAGAIFLAIVYAVNHGNIADTLALTLAAATPLAVLMPLSIFYGSLLRGMHRTALGQMPEFIVRPVGFLMLVLAATWLLGSERLNPEQTLLLQVLAALVAVGLGAYWLRNVRPSETRVTRVDYQSMHWLKAAVPLSLTGGMMLINEQADILMLGTLSTPDEVGIYRVAAQGAQLVVFFEVAMNLVISPHISRLHTQGRREELQRLLTWTTRVIFFGALCATIIYLSVGREILSWVFGTQFAPGYIALAILCVGQLIKSSCGPVGTLLNMTGFERDTAMGTGIAAVINIVLNGLLIPYFGIEGAAIATSISLVTWNIILVYRAYQRMGFVTPIWGNSAHAKTN